MPSPDLQHAKHNTHLQDWLCLEHYSQPKGEGDVSVQMLQSIKEEEMDTEQDWNIEIKMSGKEMREGYMMTDKKTDERTQQQIVS